MHRPTFDRLYAGAAAALVRTFATREADLVYIRPDGSRGGVFRAIIGAETHEEVAADDGRRRVRVLQVKVPRDDGLPFWKQPPSTRGFFEYAGQRYAVQRIESLTEHFAYVMLRREGAAEVSAEGYRYE